MADQQPLSSRDLPHAHLSPPTIPPNAHLPPSTIPHTYHHTHSRSPSLPTTQADTPTLTTSTPTPTLTQQKTLTLPRSHEVLEGLERLSEISERLGETYDTPNETVSSADQNKTQYASTINRQPDYNWEDEREMIANPFETYSSTQPVVVRFYLRSPESSDSTSSGLSGECSPSGAEETSEMSDSDSDVRRSYEKWSASGGAGASGNPIVTSGVGGEREGVSPRLPPPRHGTPPLGGHRSRHTAVSFPPQVTVETPDLCSEEPVVDSPTQVTPPSPYHWQRVTGSPPSEPPGGFMSNIELHEISAVDLKATNRASPIPKSFSCSRPPLVKSKPLSEEECLMGTPSEYPHRNVGSLSGGPRGNFSEPGTRDPPATLVTVSELHPREADPRNKLMSQDSFSKDSGDSSPSLSGKRYRKRGFIPSISITSDETLPEAVTDSRATQSLGRAASSEDLNYRPSHVVVPLSDVIADQDVNDQSRSMKIPNDGQEKDSALPSPSRMSDHRLECERVGSDTVVSIVEDEVNTIERDSVIRGDKTTCGKKVKSPLFKVKEERFQSRVCQRDGHDNPGFEHDEQDTMSQEDNSPLSDSQDQIHHHHQQQQQQKPQPQTQHIEDSKVVSPVEYPRRLSDPECSLGVKDQIFRSHSYGNELNKVMNNLSGSHDTLVTTPTLRKRSTSRGRPEVTQKEDRTVAWAGDTDDSKYEPKKDGPRTHLRPTFILGDEAQNNSSIFHKLISNPFTKLTRSESTRSHTVSRLTKAEGLSRSTSNIWEGGTRIKGVAASSHHHHHHQHGRPPTAPSTSSRDDSRHSDRHYYLQQHLYRNSRRNLQLKLHRQLSELSDPHQDDHRHNDHHKHDFLHKKHDGHADTRHARTDLRHSSHRDPRHSSPHSHHRHSSPHAHHRHSSPHSHHRHSSPHSHHRHSSPHSHHRHSSPHSLRRNLHSPDPRSHPHFPHHRSQSQRQPHRVRHEPLRRLNTYGHEQYEKYVEEHERKYEQAMERKHEHEHDAGEGKTSDGAEAASEEQGVGEGQEAARRVSHYQQEEKGRTDVERWVGVHGGGGTTDGSPANAPLLPSSPTTTPHIVVSPEDSDVNVNNNDTSDGAPNDQIGPPGSNGPVFPNAQSTPAPPPTPQTNNEDKRQRPERLSLNMTTLDLPYRKTRRNSINEMMRQYGGSQTNLQRVPSTNNIRRSSSRNSLAPSVLEWTTEGNDSLIACLSALYGKLLVVMGMAFPVAEVISREIPITFYNGFYLYLYIGSIIFLVYAYIFLLHSINIPTEQLKSKFQSLRSYMAMPDIQVFPRRNTTQEEGAGRVASRESRLSNCSEIEKDEDRASINTISHKTPKYTLTESTNHGSMYLKMGAVFFGIGSMIYSGLEVGQYFELKGNENCADVLLVISPAARMLFTFIQMYFIFLNSRVAISRHRVVARFGLMHMIGTNLCIWLNVLVQETKHEIINLTIGHDHHVEDNPDMALFWLPHETDFSGASLHGALGANHHNDESAILGHHDDHHNITGLNDTLSSLSNDTTHDNHTHDVYDLHKAANDSHNIVRRASGSHHQALSIYECTRSELMGELVDNASPFLFPCTIEYSLLCAGVLYVVWKNINKPEVTYDGDSDISTYVTRKARHHYSVDCAHANRGLFMGILILVLTIISLILFFVLINNDIYKEMAILEANIIELSVYSVATVTVVVGMIQMRELEFIPEGDIELDNILLLIAQSGVYIYTSFTVIGGHFTMTDNLILPLLSAIITLIQTTLQTIFILDASRRCCYNQDQLQRKPGREMVTFLLVCNLAMWAINTFETSRADAHPTQLNFYGIWAWTIISHVSMPLAIFYRFHVTVCLCEIWKRAYKLRHDY